VTEALDEADLLEPAQFAGQYDPHVWMDAGLWAKTVERLRDRLSEYDPEGAETYAANTEAYLKELAELDGYVRRVIGTIPEAARVMVTAHDAFNYFGRAYGLEVRGIQGISTESQAGLREIEALVSLLVEREVPAVFAETSVSDRNLRALIEGAAARGHRVVLGAKLFSDAMGAPGTYEGTYIGMLDHNATAVALALGGEAPPRGLHGRLAGVERTQ
jgi:manganese/zinc/iron transport system substrate-binding protein